MDLRLVPYVESPSAKDGDMYRECLRNHAAAMGGHSFDGCGEFMAGEAESLKCAACGCHRNFHRREGYDRKHSALQAPAPLTFFSPLPLPLPLHQIPHPDPSAAVRGGSETPPQREEGPMRKRYRTKFTAEQKVKMRSFAEKLGWRIPNHDDEALEGFCDEIGVDRRVLKIWMHNHKSNLSSTATVTVTEGGAGSGCAGRDAAQPPTIRV